MVNLLIGIIGAMICLTPLVFLAGVEYIEEKYDIR